jgi:hypothetical protein
MNEKKFEKRMAEELEEYRSDSQYYLEFRVIPAYLFDQLPWYDPDEKLRLTNINELMDSDKGLVIDWETVSVTYYTTLEVKSVFYEFPLPIEEPQAYYGMAVKRKGQPLVYYTLEMGSGDIPLFFCKVSEIEGQRMHSLIAPYEGELSAQAFIQHVLDYSETHQSFR